MTQILLFREPISTAIQNSVLTGRRFLGCSGAIPICLGPEARSGLETGMEQSRTQRKLPGKLVKKASLCQNGIWMDLFSFAVIIQDTGSCIVTIPILHW